MFARKTVKSNHDFGPPPGQEDLVGNLPCEWDKSDPYGTGADVIWSVWEPTEGERAAIANGQNVKLGVAWIGSFPPVSMTVTDEEVIS